MRRFPAERRIIARSPTPPPRKLKVRDVKTHTQGVSPPVAPRLATRTVVVADDTAFVRDRFKGALERAGHRAITVSTGNELIARVKADLATIDLVVVDLRLPHGNGVNLVRQPQVHDDEID